MRKLVVSVFSALAVAAVLAPAGSTTPISANRAQSSARSEGASMLRMTAKITRFRATRGRIVATGTVTGQLSSGHHTKRDSAPVTFEAVAKPHNGRCDVLTLHLAPLDLELLGANVTTSTINLDVYAIKGRVLGNLFCALAKAKISFPKGAARDARMLNSRLQRGSMQVFAASQRLAAGTAQSQPTSCQVLKLVLGPLHLDLLGLDVDLYGKTHSRPVIVTIDGQPSEGLLGQLLCSLAGPNGISTIGGLQSLLSSLGVNLSSTQIQHLLSQLGIKLSNGISQAELVQILQALGLGSKSP